MSAWVTNLVSEMRTRSPAEVVQKWVDSIQNDTTASTDTPSDGLLTNECLKIIIDDSSSSKCDEVCKTNEKYLDATRIENDVQVQLEKTDSNKVIETSTLATLASSESGATTTFWKKGPLIISQAFTDFTEEKQNECAAEISTEETGETTPTITSSILSKTKINEFYNKFSASRKRYSFIKERRMEARKMLNETRDRYLASPKNDATDKSDMSDSEKGSISPAANSSGAPIVCDTAAEMDISTDEFSHFSHSNEVSAEDICNLSTQSITDGQSATHLNVGRKMGIGEIGRSTSDNPRLRNKIHLADIGRSFSENQDEEAILIGERHISAPSSSMAIQNNNNNRSDGNFFERRAYSVSPTQLSNLKRGVLYRDQSLCDSPRQRSVLRKESSFHSDSSHCSSVESLLDARKPDPEAILRHLGFGPVQQEDLLSRIPKR